MDQRERVANTNDILLILKLVLTIFGDKIWVNDTKKSVRQQLQPTHRQSDSLQNSGASFPNDFKWAIPCWNAWITRMPSSSFLHFGYCCCLNKCQMHIYFTCGSILEIATKALALKLATISSNDMRAARELRTISFTSRFLQISDRMSLSERWE